MGLFGKKKEEEPEKIIVGVNPELVNEVKSKVSKIKKEKEALNNENQKLITRLSKLESDTEVRKQQLNSLRSEDEAQESEDDELNKRLIRVEASCEAVKASFNNLKDELMTNFLSQAREELKKEVSKHSESVNNNHKELMKLSDELIKLGKEIDEKEFVSSFQDYYQLIKLCIFLITNAEAEDHGFIRLVLQTIHSLVDDMQVNGFWEAGEDAIITSLLNLKSYWRSKNQQIEELIGLEVDSLKNMR